MSTFTWPDMLLGFLVENPHQRFTVDQIVEKIGSQRGTVQPMLHQLAHFRRELRRYPGGDVEWIPDTRLHDTRRRLEVLQQQLDTLQHAVAEALSGLDEPR